jgi:DNA-binding HxlR family transcriptional regulator
MESGPIVDVTTAGPGSHSPGPHGIEDTSKSCDGALTQAFKFLGKRWNGVILGTLTNGESGFAELRRNVIGISDSVLSERLGELQEAGLIVRAVKSGPPVSVSYRLSDSGSALIPALHALSVWATENISENSGDLLDTTQRHESC